MVWATFSLYDNKTSNNNSSSSISNNNNNNNIAKRLNLITNGVYTAVVRSCNVALLRFPSLFLAFFLQQFGRLLQVVTSNTTTICV